MGTNEWTGCQCASVPVSQSRGLRVKAQRRMRHQDVMMVFYAHLSDPCNMPHMIDFQLSSSRPPCAGRVMAVSSTLS